MPKGSPAHCLDSLRDFKVRPDDLFVITWPKSGTTWVELIVLLIQFGGDSIKLRDEEPHLFAKVPFLETVMLPADPDTSPSFVEVAEDMPSPRILKSHCLTEWLPREIRTEDPKVKVIYVARNPKDTAVSYFHFCQYVQFLPSYETWDCFFEEFISGRVPWGSWFENVLPWWRRRNYPNVLFLKYEDLKKDPHGSVRRIANFMGKALDDDVVNEIVSASSFGTMKQSEFANPDIIFHGEIRRNEASFLRKGVVGDWKNYFTEEQNTRFNELYRKELAGTGLDFDFEPSSQQAKL